MFYYVGIVIYSLVYLIMIPKMSSRNRILYDLIGVLAFVALPLIGDSSGTLLSALVQRGHLCPPLERRYGTPYRTQPGPSHGDTSPQHWEPGDYIQERKSWEVKEGRQGQYSIIIFIIHTARTTTNNDHG